MKGILDCKGLGMAQDHFFAPEIPPSENRTQTGIPKILDD